METTNVSVEQLCAIIGKLHVENDVLRQTNVALQLELARLKSAEDTPGAVSASLARPE